MYRNLSAGSVIAEDGLPVSFSHLERALTAAVKQTKESLLNDQVHIVSDFSVDGVGQENYQLDDQVHVVCQFRNQITEKICSMIKFTFAIKRWELTSAPNRRGSAR